MESLRLVNVSDRQLLSFSDNGNQYVLVSDVKEAFAPGLSDGAFQRRKKRLAFEFRLCPPNFLSEYVKEGKVPAHTHRASVLSVHDAIRLGTSLMTERVNSSVASNVHVIVRYKSAR